MIAFVRLRAPQLDSAGTAELLRLPALPALRYSGLILRCSRDPELRRGLEWYASVRAARPLFTFGLVAPSDLCMAPLATFTHPIIAVAKPDELIDGCVPLRMLDALRRDSIEALILQELIDERGEEILREKDLLTALIYRAINGGTLARVARDLGISRSTLRRRVRALGWRAAHLRNHIRLCAYEIRIAGGASSGGALLAGGWTDPEARRKCYRRSVRERN
jgi:AraC-like DNA-binding protein